MKEFDLELWQELYKMTKQELTKKCQVHEIKVNKSDTKYKLIVKLYTSLTT